MYAPRVGLAAELDKKFDKVRYYGLGGNEAYIDRNLSCIKDVYEAKVKDMMVHYVRPQENGSHYDTEFMEITDGATTLRAEENFSFSALPVLGKRADRNRSRLGAAQIFGYAPVARLLQCGHRLELVRSVA